MESNDDDSGDGNGIFADSDCSWLETWWDSKLSLENETNTVDTLSRLIGTLKAKRESTNTRRCRPRNGRFSRKTSTLVLNELPVMILNLEHKINNSAEVVDQDSRSQGLLSSSLDPLHSDRSVDSSRDNSGVSVNLATTKEIDMQHLLSSLEEAFPLAKPIFDPLAKVVGPTDQRHHHHKHRPDHSRAEIRSRHKYPSAAFVSCLGDVKNLDSQVEAIAEELWQWRKLHVRAQESGMFSSTHLVSRHSTMYTPPDTAIYPVVSSMSFEKLKKKEKKKLLDKMREAQGCQVDWEQFADLFCQLKHQSLHRQCNSQIIYCKPLSALRHVGSCTSPIPTERQEERRQSELIRSFNSPSTVACRLFAAPVAPAKAVYRHRVVDIGDIFRAHNPPQHDVDELLRSLLEELNQELTHFRRASAVARQRDKLAQSRLTPPRPVNSKSSSSPEYIAALDRNKQSSDSNSLNSNPSTPLPKTRSRTLSENEAHTPDGSNQELQYVATTRQSPKRHFDENMMPLAELLPHLPPVEITLKIAAEFRSSCHRIIRIKEMKLILSVWLQSFCLIPHQLRKKLLLSRVSQSYARSHNFTSSEDMRKFVEIVFELCTLYYLLAFVPCFLATNGEQIDNIKAQKQVPLGFKHLQIGLTYSRVEEGRSSNFSEEKEAFAFIRSYASYLCFNIVVAGCCASNYLQCIVEIVSFAEENERFSLASQALDAWCGVTLPYRRHLSEYSAQRPGSNLEESKRNRNQVERSLSESCFVDWNSEIELIKHNLVRVLSSDISLFLIVIVAHLPVLLRAAPMHGISLAAVMFPYIRNETFLAALVGVNRMDEFLVALKTNNIGSFASESLLFREYLSRLLFESTISGLSRRNAVCNDYYGRPIPVPSLTDESIGMYWLMLSCYFGREHQGCGSEESRRKMNGNEANSCESRGILVCDEENRFTKDLNGTISLWIDQKDPLSVDELVFVAQTIAKYRYLEGILLVCSFIIRICNSLSRQKRSTILEMILNQVKEMMSPLFQSLWDSADCYCACRKEKNDQHEKYQKSLTRLAGWLAESWKLLRVINKMMGRNGSNETTSADLAELVNRGIQCTQEQFPPRGIEDGSQMEIGTDHSFSRNRLLAEILMRCLRQVVEDRIAVETASRIPFLEEFLCVEAFW